MGSGDSTVVRHRRTALALCDMRTLYLRNVPDEVAQALEELARRESMSVSSLAVRELKAAVAFRANAEVLHRAPRLELDLEEIVDAVRSGRDT